MKKSAYLACLFLLFALPSAVSAQAAGNSDAPDKADVLKFLDLMHARAQMQQVLAAWRCK